VQHITRHKRCAYSLIISDRSRVLLLHQVLSVAKELCYVCAGIYHQGRCFIPHQD
jgi:hypothetical protein